MFDQQEQERLRQKFEEFLNQAGPSYLVERPPKDIVLKPRPTEWWFVELWYEKREFFKEFMGEVAFVGLFLASFELFHRLLGFTTLENEHIELLNKTHFYLNYSSLVILSLGFIITVLRSLFKGKKKHD